MRNRNGITSAAIAASSSRSPRRAQKRTETGNADGGASGGLRGTVVELGELVYARQAADDGTVLDYDFGIVEISADAEHLIDASMPGRGGPNATGRIDSGDPVVQYGNGVVTGETVLTEARSGVGAFNDGATGSGDAGLPAAPGDSDSAV